MAAQSIASWKLHHKRGACQCWCTKAQLQ